MVSNYHGFQTETKISIRCKENKCISLERHPTAEVGKDGHQGDFFPGFGVRVEVEHEGVEVVGHVADTHVDSVLGAA